MTEGLLSPRSPFLRPVLALLAATLLAASGLVASVAHAGQAPYASPSTTPSSAAVESGGPRWAELNASQRKVLAPLAADWNGLDSRSKERWLDVAGRFPKMPADEQQRANQRMGEWAHMTVAQRIQARLNFQETRSVSKEEREARWKAYQALPDEKKRELAEKRAAAAAPASAASSSTAQAKRHLPPPVYTVQPKTNVVGPAAPVRTAAGSAPLVASVHPGATTTLLTRRATPPAHQPDGQPKIAAGPNYVDRTTLLPKHAATAKVSEAASTAAAHR